MHSQSHEFNKIFVYLMKKIFGLLLLFCIPTTSMADFLHVATGLAKPPYVEEGSQSGVEVEIVRAVLEKAGYQTRFTAYPPARGLALLEAGKIDAMLSLESNKKIKAYISAPVIYYHNKIITLADRKLQIKTLSDLHPLHVAAFQNASLFLGREYAKTVKTLTQYKEYANQNALPRLLYHHRVDAVIGDEFVFRAQTHIQNIIPTNGDQLKIFDLFPISPRSVGFLKDADRKIFDATLKTMQNSGEIEKILQRYRKRYQMPTAFPSTAPTRLHTKSPK